VSKSVIAIYGHLPLTRKHVNTAFDEDMGALDVDHSRLIVPTELFLVLCIDCRYEVTG
jgi:hypothetical protein